MVLQIFLETGQNVMEEMQTVRYEDFEVGQGAELGETDTGKLVFDDPGGLYTLVGWRHWRAIETTASPTLIASGRIMAKGITRGDDLRGSLRTGADRQWDCDACDENILLGIRVIRGTAANRPAETAGERLRWLLSTSFTTLIDNGHITYPTDRLDAHDYTGENDKDLIASCAAPGGYNYFAVKDTASSTTELFFMLPTSSSWQSSIRISNDLSDIDDVTTFEAAYTTSVRRSPERIAEGVFLPFAGGSGSSYVYVSDSTIGDQYAYVDKTAPMAEVHTSTAATVVANRLLAASNEEDDRISTSISVPAAQVNDLRLWHRVQVKLTHVPGYENFRWCRVLHRSVKPEGPNYRITMELVPVEAGTYTGDTFAAILGGQGAASVPYFRFTGDVPPGGWFVEPLLGPLEIVQTVSPFTSIRALETMTVRITLQIDNAAVLPAGQGGTLNLLVNGVSIGSSTNFTPGGFWALRWTIDVRNYTLNAGDIVSFSYSGVGDPGWGDSGTNSTYLRIARGTFFTGASTWVGP